MERAIRCTSRQTDRQEMWRSTSDGSRLISLKCFRVNNYSRCYASQDAQTEIPVKTKLQLKAQKESVQKLVKLCYSVSVV
jgi:hypothetical protein